MPSVAQEIARIGDSAVENVEQMYRDLIGILRPGASEEDVQLWPPIEDPDESRGDDW